MSSSSPPPAEQDAKVARLQQTIGLVLSDGNDSRLKGLLAFGSFFLLVDQSGVVGCLVEFLEIDDSPNLQFAAVCVISTIASSENTLAMVKHGAVPNLLKLLCSTFDSIREKAVEALGEIAHGDSPDCREILLSSGAFEAFFPHLSEDAGSSMVKLAIRALSKFWIAKPTPSLYQQGNIERVINMSICPRLVQLLGHPNLNVLYPVLHAVNMMSYGDEFHIQCMINDNVLPRLVNLLTNDHVMRIKDSRVIWHLTFRSKMLKEAVVASGAISALINLLQNPEFDTKKKAAWAIRNVTYEASKDQIKYLVDEGCVRTLCNLLDSRDQETLKVCLQGLESILKAGEYEKNLESSGDDNVYAHKFKEAEGVRMKRKLLNDDGPGCKNS
ncbi:Importin subunit alpha-1a-like protein [Drosera capensis]